MSIKSRVRADGKRVFDVQVYVESRAANGKRKKVTRTVATKKEAIALDAALKVESAGGAVRDGRRTVADLLDAWLAAGTWSPTTKYNYTCLVEGRLKALLGRQKLDRLTAAQLDRFYVQVRAEGLSGRSVRNYHRVLTAALNRGVRWGWIPYSPATKATLGPVRGEEGRVATEDEIRKLLAAADPDMAFVIRLACATGMRRSELAALDWSDIDFKSGVITVSRAVVDAGGKQFEKDTKSHAVRQVPVGAATLELLKSRRGIGPVIGWSPSALSKRFRALCDQAGVQGLGLHGLRHYCGTQLVGITDLRTVQAHLGHKDMATTARYLHKVEERSKAAAEALDALL